MEPQIKKMLMGLFGVLLLTVGGSLVMFGLHWIIWNAPGSLHPPSNIKWLVTYSFPIGFFLIGLGLLTILWSRPVVQDE